jgi:hypothetical protein
VIAFAAALEEGNGRRHSRLSRQNFKTGPRLVEVTS